MPKDHLSLRHWVQTAFGPSIPVSGAAFSRTLKALKHHGIEYEITLVGRDQYLHRKDAPCPHRTEPATLCWPPKPPDGDEPSFAQGVVSREPGPLGEPPRRLLQALIQSTLKMMGVDPAEVFGQGADTAEKGPTR